MGSMCILIDATLRPASERAPSDWPACWKDLPALANTELDLDNRIAQGMMSSHPSIMMLCATHGNPPLSGADKILNESKAIA